MENTRKQVRFRAALCGLAVLFFILFLVWPSYLPGHGFSALIRFGELMDDRYIERLRATNPYLEDKSHGYDAQWYAQLAIQPDIRDPALWVGIDNLPYRARRMLLCWTAYLLGFGQPKWIVQIYALQGVAAWFLLAWLLTRWLRPTADWESLVRWTAVMFAHGLIVSVRSALVDGPSLLLIAIGVALLEKGRPWVSALVLSLAGLCKETNLLALGGPGWPVGRSYKGWLVAAGRVLIIILPLSIWLCLVVYTAGPQGSSGDRNFSTPFQGIWNECMRTVEILRMAGLRSALPIFCVLTALITQFMFFVLTPRLAQAWWRVAIAYAVLMIFLGDSVWEGTPGAATRVLLPMTLAFNVLLPRGRRWVPLLVLGNLSLFATPSAFQPPSGGAYRLTGQAELMQSQTSGGNWKVTFDDGWYLAERKYWTSWRWSAGSARIVVTNPEKRAIEADVSFAINSLTPRDLRLTVNGAERLTAKLGRERVGVKLSGVLFPPGASPIDFITDQPGQNPENPADTRPLAFRMYDLEIALRRASPANAP